jgi:hypothetical protein
MELNIRPLTLEDYDTILVGWWNGWRWSEVPSRDILPQNGKGGIIVYDGDVPVCAGFIYTTNSSIAWIDWIVSNPEYRDYRKECIQYLIDTLTNICQNLGCKFAYTLFTGTYLEKYFEGSGFVRGSKYKSEMIKIWE